MAEQFPVFVEVRRADGSTERVRVGAAVKEAEGFLLQLGELHVGAGPEAPRRTAPAAGTFGGGGGGEVFPNYGRSKGMPIRGASIQDLEFYANGARRSLNDPSKARFHDKERALLGLIEAELARQQGGQGEAGAEWGGGTDEPPPPGDEDAPF